VVSFIGGVLRALPIALLGWWLKEAYIEYAGVFSGLESYILGAVAIFGLGITLILFIRKKKKI
ncbi:MAG: hypothetical protein AAB903_01675, partial [Patescibacteria group bacterium]